MLPIIIFAVGWLKPIYSIIFTAVTIVSLFFAIKNSEQEALPFGGKKDLKPIIITAVIVLLWVILSGIGKMVYQNEDHTYRNAVFEILTESKWPVVYNNSAKYKNPVALVYYFAFWLPAAVIGKLINLEAGYIAQIVWAFIGVFLTMLYIFSIKKRIKLWYVFVFIFFSGLDIVCQYIFNADIKIIDSQHIEWLGIFQYTSHTTQLFWVFHQSVPAWLLTMVILSQKNIKSIVFLYSSALLSCTIAAVGLLPLVIYKTAELVYDRKKSIKENIKKLILSACTFTNIAGGGMIGIILYLFIKINNSGQAVGLIDIKSNLLQYVLFILIEVLIYMALSYKYCSRKRLFALTLIALAAIPLVKVGHGSDFCMRASIPFIVVMYLFVIDALEKSFCAKDYRIGVLLSIAVLVGCITPVHEFIRTIQNTMDGNIVQEEKDLITDWQRDNFFGEYENTMFFKYLAK